MHGQPFVPQSGIERAFAHIAGIPHPSSHEKALSDSLLSRYERLGLSVYQDSMANLLVKKPGSAGCGHLPAVMLTAHMDMVPARSADSRHDFLTDPIALVVRDGQLYADGTTLGADDGYGVAYMMDLLERKDAVHPPIECLFTVQEEIGLLGAAAFDYARISARQVISMDMGALHGTTISTAGGELIRLALPLDREAGRGAGLCIKVSGLMGGHSGGDIDKGRGNAIALLGELLSRIAAETSAVLHALSGGEAHNAIARDAGAVISADVDALCRVRAIADESLARWQDTFEAEKGLALTVEEAPVPDAGYSLARAAQLLAAAPSGVFRMHETQPGLIMTSANLGTLSIEVGEMNLLVMMRSVKRSTAQMWEARYSAIARGLGARIEIGDAYPGWTYQPDSPLRERLMRASERVTGRRPDLEATHGGMEVGYFAQGLPGADIITLGCDMKNLHTPQEHMDLASFQLGYEVLLDLLRSLTEER